MSTGFSLKKGARGCFVSQVKLKQELQGLVSRLTSVVKVRDNFLDQVLRGRLSLHLEKEFSRVKRAKQVKKRG